MVRGQNDQWAAVDILQIELKVGRRAIIKYCRHIDLLSAGGGGQEFGICCIRRLHLRRWLGRCGRLCDG